VIRRRLSIILILGILLTVFATTASADTSPNRRYVRLTDGSETSGFRTYAETVGEFLEAEGILLNAKDIVSLELDAELEAGEITELWIRRSFTIYISIDNDEAFEFEVGATQRVGHIIAELRDLKESEFRHDGFLNDALVQGTTLYLRSVTVRESIMAVRQPYHQEVRLTRGLPPGEIEVLQEGVAGEITTVIHTFYIGGVEIDRRVVSVAQTIEPIAEIIVKGDTSPEPPPHIPLPRGTIISLNGTVGNGYAYTISKVMESTAYSAQQPELSNYTASGHRAVRGVIAVDPAVIPLGTWVYVEGYGKALASDTGSAIRGYKIDLCFDTVAEAIQHGRRNVRVWILSDTF